MSKFIITSPNIDDARGLAEMHTRSWIDVYPNEEAGVSLAFIKKYVVKFTNNDGIAKRTAYIREGKTNPDYLLRIAKDQAGKIVGFVDSRKRDGTFELNGLYIDTSAYGSGLALELANLALDWLGRNNEIKVTLVVYNERAKHFYEKLGFEYVPGSETIHNNTPLTVMDMIRKGDSK